jgi:hypothetical protein
MTPARLAKVICCRRAGIVVAFEVVKVILWDGFLRGGWGGILDYVTIMATM